jgi:hypothetical protein
LKVVCQGLLMSAFVMCTAMSMLAWRTGSVFRQAVVLHTLSKCLNIYYCETVSEQRAARCIVAPGGPDQRRCEAHPGIPPPVPRVKKHETPERD